MDKESIKYFLPSDILKYFNILRIYETINQTLSAAEIHIELEEINRIPEGYDESEYESKGFYPTKSIQDFPIRGKAVYLKIKRRRWRHKVNKNEVIHNDYSMFSGGSKFTQELSDFLKDTGRYQS